MEFSLNTSLGFKLGKARKILAYLDGPSILSHT
jgi:hypothetical protein